jgi:nitrilase
VPRITAVQTNSSDNIDHNLVVAETHIVQASKQGSELIVLPECFALMQKSRSQLLQCAEMDGSGKIQEFLSATAKANKVWIIGGSVPMQSGAADKVTNSLLVYDEEGSRVARYDKIFLFDVALASGERYCESDYTIPGSSIAVIDSPVGKIGLSICYDVRFPELYRTLTHMGAQLLIVPSAFSCTTGQDHWLPLLRARAIENACYVVAPAQTGIHSNGRKTWGHTVIIDPWGKVLAEMKSEPGIVSADIDLNKLVGIREQLPSLLHCRPELF